MPIITLPDGSKKVFEQSVTILDIAESIGPGLAKATVAGKINGILVDASEKITEDSDVILQFGGGCQGCGMIDVTLKDGIETTLIEQIPEIRSVKDITDHSINENAYYPQEQES